jgi:hypothetical protein
MLPQRRSAHRFLELLRNAGGPHTSLDRKIRQSAITVRHAIVWITKRYVKLV